MNKLGLPAATEFLDLITPQYIADLIAWGAIGARTTESQIHRELASGLSCPIGFKNGTDGNVRIAAEAVKSAAASVDAAAAVLGKVGVAPRVMIDASHANSGKKPENQPAVAADVARQVAAGDNRIIGLMIESNIAAGRQDVVPNKPLTYGQSITDGCIDWATTESVLHELAAAVEADGCIDWATTESVLHELAAAVEAKRAARQPQRQQHGGAAA